MGDQVQVRIEEMLPELVDLEENQVFSRAEIQKMMKSRKSFEIEICSKNAGLPNFRNYIQHEMAVESLKRIRQGKLSIHKLGVANFSIIRRVHYLYTRALKKFAADKELWLEHIMFCADTGSVTSLNKVIMRALRFHSREATFWALAAERQARLGHVDSARTLIMKGMRVKPVNPLVLWDSLLKLEIMVSAKVAGNVKTVESVFEKAWVALVSARDREELGVSVLKQVGALPNFAEFADKCRSALVELKGADFVKSIDADDGDLGFIEDTVPIVVSH